MIRIINKSPLLEWLDSAREFVSKNGSEENIQTIDALKEKFIQQKFCLSIFGKVKRGKSTLANALLGRTDDLVAPVDRLPATCVFTTYANDKEEKAQVIYLEEGRTPDRISFQEIRAYVTEELNPENEKRVERVKVTAPFGNLDKDVVLVDLPGAGSIHEHHDAIVLKYIPISDAVIFLVTADAPITKQELDLLKRLDQNQSKKIFFVINKIDIVDDNELLECITHNREILHQANIQVEKFYTISAKNAMLKGEGNISDLISAISKHITENRMTQIECNIRESVNNLLLKIKESIEIEIEFSESSKEDLEVELNRLNEQKVQNEEKKRYAQDRFKLEWSKVINAFVVELDECENNVIDNLTKKIEATWANNTTNLVDNLPQDVQIEITKEIQPKTMELEKNIERIINKLEVDFPHLQMSPNMSMNISTSKMSNEELIKGSIKTVACMGTGGTLLVASSAPLAAMSGLTTTLSGIPIIGGGLGTAGTVLTGAASILAAPVVLTGFGLLTIGALVLPLAYKKKKLQQKEQCLIAMRDTVRNVFNQIKCKYKPDFLLYGDDILQEFFVRAKERDYTIINAIKQVIARKNDPSGPHFIEGKQAKLDNIRLLLESN